MGDKLEGGRLGGPADIPEGKIDQARAIQRKGHGMSPPGATALGIWSRGCYFVESEEVTEHRAYGRYWRMVECVA
jgi:hypothetical protein